jgi:ubiquitin C-terminal hydrolase
VKVIFTEIINTNYNLIGFCSYYNINERYCRHFYFGEDKKWYLHDTDEIREVSLKDIEKGNPYFLFYQRISD